MKKIFLYIIYLSFITLSACSASQTGLLMSQVSKGYTQDKEQKYVVIPANANINKDSLEFNEYANYVAKAMHLKNFTVVQTIDEADAAVFLSYGVSDPKTYQYTVNTPIWGQTGVQSSTTYGMVNPYTGQYSQSTTFTPQYGITGYIPELRTVTYYIKHLKLDAFLINKQSKNVTLGNPLWRIVVTSSDENGILRDTFPAMIFGARDYIGTDSKHSIEFEINQNDKELTDFISK